LASLKLPRLPDLLLGVEHGSDAAVYRLTEELALVVSVDFFTPIVDDPYLFGQIAAANALSDLYALGARPVLALNVVGFPKKGLDREILRQILQGGADKVAEAGAALGGGHSVDDPEIKYGLCVVGLVHPERFVTNAGAKPGDRLILTKPLGTGILSTALKGGLLSTEDPAYQRLLEAMLELNRAASEAMMEIGVHAATDITGFGLLGHALEMAEASQVTLSLHSSHIPLLPKTLEFLKLGMAPEGDLANQIFCEKKVQIHPGVDPLNLAVLYDAQTSGGLLIAVSSDKAEALFERLLEKGVVEAAFVGEVKEGPARIEVWP